MGNYYWLILVMTSFSFLQWAKRRKTDSPLFLFIFYSSLYVETGQPHYLICVVMYFSRLDLNHIKTNHRKPTALCGPGLLSVCLCVELSACLSVWHPPSSSSVLSQQRPKPTLCSDFEYLAPDCGKLEYVLLSKVTLQQRRARERK